MKRSNPPHLRPLEQFLAALGLTVIPVLDFDPVRRALLRYPIPRVLPLGDDAFQIQFTGFVEEFAAALLDVIDIEHSRSVLPDECFQPCLALHEWQLAKIITIEK